MQVIASGRIRKPVSSSIPLHIIIGQCVCSRNVVKATPNSIQKYSRASEYFSIHACHRTLPKKNSEKPALGPLRHKNFNHPEQEHTF